MCLPVKPFKIEREWTHAGFACAITQPHEHAHRCGYVRVPANHLLHGNSGDVLGAHGGITFSQLEPCTEHEDGQGWWFGFDCAHAFDALWEPGYEPDFYKQPGGLHHRHDHYWTQAEVEAECERLAEQLAEMETNAENQTQAR